MKKKIKTNLLKEKLIKIKSSANESQGEQIKQIERDLNREWEDKLAKSLQQVEQKHERVRKLLADENGELKKLISEFSEQVKVLKASATVAQSENETLRQSLEEMSELKSKFETFQSRAVLMKERYESKIKELAEAEPDPEVIGEEVKKVMNAMYKKIKSQIKQEQYYSGNGILTAMLKIIKMVTLQLFQSQDEQDEEADVDYFSQHIYVKSNLLNLLINAYSHRTFNPNLKILVWIEKNRITKTIIIQ